MSFRACGIQTTKDAANPKRHVGGDQKQKYNLEWPNFCFKEEKQSVACKFSRGWEVKKVGIVPKINNSINK